MGKVLTGKLSCTWTDLVCKELLYKFSAKNITAVDFMSTVRFKEISTNNFVKLTML